MWAQKANMWAQKANMLGPRRRTIGDVVDAGGWCCQREALGERSLGEHTATASGRICANAWHTGTTASSRTRDTCLLEPEGECGAGAGRR